MDVIIEKWGVLSSLRKMEIEILRRADTQTPDMPASQRAQRLKKFKISLRD